MTGGRKRDRERERERGGGGYLIDSKPDYIYRRKYIVISLHSHRIMLSSSLLVLLTSKTSSHELISTPNYIVYTLASSLLHFYLTSVFKSRIVHTSSNRQTISPKLHVRCYSNLRSINFKRTLTTKAPFTPDLCRVAWRCVPTTPK